MTFYLIFGLILLIGLWTITSYNSLVKRKIRAREAWSDIEIQLKRRYNLIPNLVATIKGYTSHERETLEKVVQARNQTMEA